MSAGSRFAPQTVRACALWALAASSCRDDAELDRDMDRATSSLDGAVLDATRPRPVRDAGFDAGPPTLVSSEDCSGPLPAPDASMCAAPDPSEPNEPRDPARLTLTPGCGFAIGQAADKDRDVFRFLTPKGDPVAIELAYRDELRADLGFEIRDRNGRAVVRQHSTRTAVSEHEVVTMLAEAEAQYDLQVVGTHIGTCVPYALRVDPSWCSDRYEDNDTAAQATPLTWSSGGVIEFEASGSRFEADFYTFAPEKADPVLVTGDYEVDTTSNLQLRRVLSNVTGLNAIDEPGQRTGTRETWRHWLRSDTPRYLMQVAPRGDGCAVYRMRIDASACTDDYEDNDQAHNASPLTPGRELEATAFAGDDDFYDVSALTPGGRCHLRYALSPGDAQRLRIDVSSENAGVIASGLGAPTASSNTQTLTVSWRTPGATRLNVRAELPNHCQRYQLRCEPSEQSPPGGQLTP